MDILTVVGLTVGIGAILLGQVLEGGHIGSIMQGTAALIVFGGTLGAVLIHYPLSICVMSLKMGVKAFTESKSKDKEIMSQIIALAGIARKEGLLAIEAKLKDIENPFFRKGLEMVVDGTEPRVIREILEIDMENEEERGESAAKFYEAAGAYAPTVGIIGAVLGLIHVMENLAEPEKLGGGIAVAFVATVYGVGTANLLCLPVGGKIKLKVKKERTLRELITEGCVAVAEGENPHHIRSKLEGFLEVSQRDQN